MKLPIPTVRGHPNGSLHSAASKTATPDSATSHDAAPSAPSIAAMTAFDQQKICEMEEQAAAGCGRALAMTRPTGSLAMTRPTGSLAWMSSFILHGAVVIAATLIPGSWLSPIQMAGQQQVAQLDSAFSPDESPAAQAASVAELTPASVPEAFPPERSPESIELASEHADTPETGDLRDRILDASAAVSRQRSALRAPAKPAIPALIARSRTTPDSPSTQTPARLAHVSKSRPAAEPAPESPETPAIRTSQLRPVPVPEAFELPPRETSPATTAATTSTAASTASLASQSTPEMAGAENVPAQPQSTPAPQYPVESARLREQGRILLRVEVSNTGQVTSATVFESSGFSRLDTAARETVLTWRFRPAMRDGQPVASRLNIPIRFAL